MAITPGFKTNAEGEEEYIDKGAVNTPQVNSEVNDKYIKAKTKADIIDFVEWPTDVHGQEKQGF